MDNQQLIDFFKALASEKRQQMLLEIFLDGKSHPVSEVAARTSLAMSTASAHLHILRRAGILTSEKVGKDVFFQGDRKFMVKTFRALADKFDCC
ncbi:helix-turn-helix transcriptional regulator [Aliikangiella sp. G2MR2-5]|uniref:ArsR/SmtB family transcription factor n=1 Tax=Aliikangiella sp. G2MR2-5 TaxID=2788943 RepID=UPI0018A93D42|nr:metalloregulator ArsR/SmtB family transcription factor [Aliikangiella sp. G2MR2-5]